MAKLLRSLAARYGVAALAVGLALIITLQIDLLASRTPLALFFAAVVVGTWYGGRNPGLLAIALAALASDYFIIPPLYSLLPKPQSIFQIATFVLVALLINFLTTARQRSEQLLRENEDRYRLLFDCNPLPMWVYDLKTLRFLAVNEATVACYGYSREELLAMTIKDIRPATEIPALLDTVKNSSCSLEMAGIWKHRKKDGTLFDVQITSQAIDFAGHRAEIILANDVTERVRAEESLRESESKLSGIIESAMDAIITVDGEERVVLFNAAAERVFQCPAEEAVGQSLDRFIPERFRATHQGHILDFGRTNVTKRSMGALGAIFGLRADGEEFPIEASISQLESGGQKFYTVILRDITERKQAEEALRAKSDELSALMQQLWQASRLAVMGELAASVAHELNNPLATVSLRTESLLAQVAEDDPRRRPLEIIDQEVERMGSLVGNLLQFSRRTHQQVSTVDVRQEIVNTLEFIHYHLRKHQINIGREFADEVPTVQADRQQMRQLFLNLLTNACDAMPEGGRLTLRVNAGRLPDGARAVSLEFEDTGAGITPDDLAKVWDPFFTTKPEGKGTGLGLAICRRIVEEHGGTINIESAAGRGTTVRIVLPATNREKN